MEKRVYSDSTLLKRKRKIIILSALFMFILSVLILFIATYYNRCDNWECFSYNLAKCTKTKFAGGDDILYGYIIEGKSGDYCSVNVTLLEGQLNNQDTTALKGKSMVCLLDYGVVSEPSSDLSVCHGELKESLQEQVINKLYTYLVQNLGQINKDIIDPLDVINE